MPRSENQILAFIEAHKLDLPFAKLLRHNLPDFIRFATFAFAISHIFKDALADLHNGSRPWYAYQNDI